LAKKGELELFLFLKTQGFNCIHGLKKQRIKQEIQPGKNGNKATQWLEKNKQHPRKKATMEVDVFAWKQGVWGAMAIEQKSRSSSSKTLSIGSGIRLFTSKSQIREGGEKLLLQCQGVGLLGKAFASAKNLEQQVVPVGVVDYEIKVFGTPSNWAFYDGVFFVREEWFPQFVQEFQKKRGWVRQLAEKTC
jgi:hypothetical protein